MSIERILVIVSISLNLLMFVLTMIIRFSKSTKTQSIASKIYDVIKNVQTLVVDAETHTNYTGSEKFDYVMTGMTKYLLTNNIKMDADLVTKLIENEIDVSNNVNTPITKKSYVNAIAPAQNLKEV